MKIVDIFSDWLFERFKDNGLYGDDQHIHRAPELEIMSLARDAFQYAFDDETEKGRMKDIGCKYDDRFSNHPEVVRRLKLLRVNCTNARRNGQLTEQQIDEIIATAQRDIGRKNLAELNL